MPEDHSLERDIIKSSTTIKHGDGDVEEEIEESKEDGVLFYQNRSGIPVDAKTWERMWTHATHIHPDGMNKVQSIRKQSAYAEVRKCYEQHSIQECVR